MRQPRNAGDHGGSRASVAFKSLHHRAATRVLSPPGFVPTVRPIKPSSVAHIPTMDPRFIDDLARRLSASVPQGLANVRRDLEDNFKAVLQSAL